MLCKCCFGWWQCFQWSPFFTKSSQGHIFTSVVEVLLEYMRQPKRSRLLTEDSIMLRSGWHTSCNRNAVLPCIPCCELVASMKAWKKSRPLLLSSPRFAASWCICMYRRCLPVPNSIHISSSSSCENMPILLW